MTGRVERYRSSITLRVCPCHERDRLARLLTRIREREPGPTLIICNTHGETTDLKTDLLHHGIVAQSLTGGAHEPDKAVLEWFSAKEAPVLVVSADIRNRIARASLRYAYLYSLPASPEHLLESVLLAGRDGLESFVDVFACPEDRERIANAIRATTPDSAEVHDLLALLLPPEGEEREIGEYDTAVRTNLPWRTVVTVLGHLKQNGAYAHEERFHAVAILEPKRTSREILARFDRKRSQFLRALFLRAEPRGDILRLDMARASEALGEPRDRIVAALKHLDECDDMDVYFRDERALCRRTEGVDTSILEPEILECVTRDELDALAALGTVVNLIEHQGCRWGTLLDGFGEDLGRACGHCDWCLGARPGLLPALERDTRKESKALDAVNDVESDYLDTPRRGARFLTGHGSPALRKTGLHKHPLYSCLDTTPFLEILKWLTKTRTPEELH